PSRSTTARSHCCATLGDAAQINPSKTPTITPVGFLVSTVTAIPSPVQAKNRITETTLMRGASPAMRRPLVRSVVLVSSAMGFLPFHVQPSVLEKSDSGFRREAQRSGPAQEAIRQLDQLPLPIREPSRPAFQVADERADTPVCFENAR